MDPDATQQSGDFGDPPEKPDTEQSQDELFRLTGTTFAGATDMGSTAGMGESRPDTVGTYLALDTRPGSVMPLARLGEEGPDDTSVFSTGRTNRLLIEAELRAEHQACARNTMLDLAHALDHSNSRSRELGALLRTECATSASLREERDQLAEAVQRMQDEEEKKEAAALIDKALASGNKMFFGMLMTQAREGFEFKHFDPSSDGKERERQQERELAMAGDGDNNAPAAVGENKAPVAAGEKEACGASEDRVANMTSAFTAVGAGAGDKVQVSWVVKLWWREVELTRARKERERQEKERLAKIAEEERRIAEAKQKAKDEVAKMVADLESQLERARKLMEEQAAKQSKLEREAFEAKAAAERAAELALIERTRIEKELAETNELLVHTRRSLLALQTEYEASQEALRKADQAFGAERAQLQSVIRQVQSELQEAMVLAKHMRETALKAKRDAAGSVSPSKFAELIAQMEEMKSQLSVIMKDCLHEKSQNDWLSRNLDKNRRQLELERQFLPLLRKVRGPVGPKVGAEDEKNAKEAKRLQATQKAMPPVPAGASPNQLRASQSMGALNDTRATTAGGPLAGGRSGGFQDDKKQFASSLGFANGNSQGSPMRG